MKRRDNQEEKRAKDQFESIDPKQQLGDAPVDAEYHGRMEFLARQIDHLFNGDLRGQAKQVGFVLLVFPFNDHQGRCNYMSNAQREDVVVLLKEQIARFEADKASSA